MHQKFTNAVKDSLTGLYTRDILQPLFDSLIKREMFSLFMIDIDNFKLINDCNGHLRGDQALIDMAGFLKESVKTGYIIRMGGDEFVIILPGFRKVDAVRFADRLFLNINKKIFEGDPDLSLSLSAGIVLYPEDGKDVKGLLKKADQRLYIAKRKGRAQFCIEDDEVKRKPRLITESTRLIGKDNVFLLMRERFDKAMEGKSQILIVNGECGVGKTFICNRFLEYAKIRGAELKKVEFLRSPLSSTNTLEKIAKSFPSLPRPLVLFVDHLENADKDSIKILVYLWERSIDLPILFLITIQEEKKLPINNLIDGIKGKEDVRIVTLKGFNKGCFVAYTKSLLGGFNVSQMFLNFLFRKTEGNPLIAKEFLNSLITKGVLSKKRGEWRIEEQKKVDIINDSLRNLLEYRVQHLSKNEKEILTWASIIGKDFEVEYLMHLIGIDMKSILPLLRRPIELGIVDDNKDGVFSFRKLYREYFYEKIPGTERKLFHKRTAQVIEMKHKKGNEEKIFYHYNQAVEKSKAIYYAEKLCKYGIRKGNFEEAKTYADFLLKNYEKTHPHYISILFLTGECYVMNGVYDEAIEKYRTIIEIDPSLKVKSLLRIAGVYNKMGKYSLALEELLKIKVKPSPLMCTILNRISNNLLKLGQLEKAEEYVKKAIILSKKYKVKIKEAEGYYTIGGVFWYRGEYELGEDFLLRALKIYKSFEKPVETALAMNRLGIIRWSQGKLVEAEELIEKAVEIFKKFSRIEEENRAYTNLGILNEALGKWEEAKTYYIKSIKIGELLNLTSLLCKNYINLGTLLLKEGRYKDALLYFKKTIPISTKSGDEIGLASSYHNLGVTYMFLGDYKTSAYFLRRAGRIFDKKGITGMRIDNLTTVFELSIYKKQFLKAQGLMEEIGGLIEVNGTDFQKAQYYRVMAKYMRARNRPEEARKFARLSVEMLNEGEEGYELGKSYLELAQILHSEGDNQGAEKTIMKTKSILKRLGAEKALERVNSIKERWNSE